MNDMFLDDIKKDVSVTTYTDTSTSAIHTYPGVLLFDTLLQRAMQANNEKQS